MQVPQLAKVPPQLLFGVPHVFPSEAQVEGVQSQRKEELQKLLEKLEQYGVIEFARSGRVVILKWSKRFHQHLQDFELLGTK